MNLKAFALEFAYQGIHYRGLARPFLQDEGINYLVNVQDESQETAVEVVLGPTTSSLEDWDYECPDGGKADQRYDKELLIEIGEQVEACLKDLLVGE